MSWKKLMMFLPEVVFGLLVVSGPIVVEAGDKLTVVMATVRVSEDREQLKTSITTKQCCKLIQNSILRCGDEFEIFMQTLANFWENSDFHARLTQQKLTICHGRY
jgi:hypothetical protein